MKTKRRAQKNNTPVAKKSAPPTVMTHVMELQSRLFSSVAAFLLVACLAYPFFDTIVTIIVAPLGEAHELVYLTPGGAFGFMIKVCISVGVLGALPVIVFNIYRFLLPAVQTARLRKALGYTAVSVMLALVGVIFAYTISLPASLYFLTNFDLHHINPMLTIDSYFSFVMTYIIAGAVLFQLPLIILIIDSITPLKPSNMMKHQKHILLGSFIVAAIISPTPDVLNQSLLAAPVVVMYQLSIAIIAVKHRKRVRAEKKMSRSAKGAVQRQVERAEDLPPATPQPALAATTPEASPVAPLQLHTAKYVSDISGRSHPRALRTQLAPRIQQRSTSRAGGYKTAPAGRGASIDGMRVRAPGRLYSAERSRISADRSLVPKPNLSSEKPSQPRSFDGIIFYA